MSVAVLPTAQDGRKAALEIAHAWAERGVPAFPIAISYDPDKYDGTGGTDKRPLTPNGHQNATTDPDQLTQQFADAHPRPGEIIACGLHPGGASLVCLDLDRKGGKNGIVVADQLGLRDTWGATTPSGGEHRIFRRPEHLRIANTSPWADYGIDIRGDDGWIVAPGTRTPFGNWLKLPDAEWPTDIQPIPTETLSRLTVRNLNQTNPTNSPTGWTRLTDDQRALLHPATRAAVEHLETAGGHSPIHKTQPGREPWVEITRPGKRHGTSATIGYVGPGIIRSFTPNWPGIPEGVHDTDENGRPVPAGHIDQWPNDPAIADIRSPDQVLADAANSSADQDQELAALVLHEIRRQRARDLARIAIANTRPAVPYDDGTLAEYQGKPITWRIEGVLPADGRALVVAQHKTGKTTLALNITRTLLEGGMFLGRYPTSPINGRVGFLNFEVSGEQFKAWAAEAGLDTEDRIYLNNLRGHPNPFGTGRERERLIERLVGHDVRALIIDPFRRAFHGDDPDKTGQVNQWTELVDQLAHQANVSEIVVLHHTGHDTTRLRNSSALADWPDTIVTLTRNEDGDRYLSAIGRDVDIEEDQLHYDPWTRHLTLTGNGGKKASRETARLDRLSEKAAEIVNSHPDKRGLSGQGIERAFKDLGISFRKGDGAKAGRVAAARTLVAQDDTGTNTVYLPAPPRTSPHLPAGDVPGPRAYIQSAGSGEGTHPDDWINP